MNKNWQQKLADSTGQWAFVLTLSRRMIWMMQVVRDCDYSGIVNANVSHITLTRLESRGLVIFKFKKEAPFGGKWELTPAGECIVKLLEFAGLMSREKITKVA